MEFFFLINITSKNIIKYEQIHKKHEIFEKTRSINAIKFNNFQRKPVNTLNWWDDKVFYHSYFTNEPLQHVTD